MVSTMTVSPATRRLGAACPLAPTILARAEATEARRELLPQLFETIADAGFMPLPRGFHCLELTEPAVRGWSGRNLTEVSSLVRARDSAVIPQGKRYER